MGQAHEQDVTSREAGTMFRHAAAAAGIPESRRRQASRPARTSGIWQPISTFAQPTNRLVGRLGSARFRIEQHPGGGWAKI